MLGRRADGYHDLDTLAVFADLGDTLAVTEAPELTLSVSGPFAAHAPAGSGNLVLNAASLLSAHMSGSCGAAMSLTKSVPSGAGFGGGSADAAATLHLLNEIWGLGLGHGRLAEIGLRIGADVPMCLVGKGLRARGVGERIEALSGFPALPLVLVWPGASVSTARVFSVAEAAAGAPLPKMQKFWTPADVGAWLIGARNDLEQAARSLAPAIGEALEALRATRGCMLARMSGSGSGCFALYGTRAEAAVAAKAVQDLRKGWWIAATEAR